jgi:hypothetical protein
LKNLSRRRSRRVPGAGLEAEEPESGEEEGAAAVGSLRHGGLAPDVRRGDR